MAVTDKLRGVVEELRRDLVGVDHQVNLLPPTRTAKSDLFNSHA